MLYVYEISKRLKCNNDASVMTNTSSQVLDMEARSMKLEI